MKTVDLPHIPWVYRLNMCVCVYIYIYVALVVLRDSTHRYVEDCGRNPCWESQLLQWHGKTHGHLTHG